MLYFQVGLWGLKECTVCIRFWKMWTVVTHTASLVYHSRTGGYVLPGVCSYNVKTTDRIFTKIIPDMYLCTRKSP